MNCKQYVMDNIDLSDHWPVVAEIPLSTQGAVIENCSFRSFDVDLEKLVSKLNYGEIIIDFKVWLINLRKWERK